ncbi:MAG: hypothetical protein JNM18_06820 [Planctomycetaceae bacterium]|nr:hypothetical protein [Planctomycetaceae bacterium]
MDRHPPLDEELPEPPRRWEPILGRFSIRSILLATVMASAGASAFSAGYYTVAIVAIAFTVAAFIAFAPQPNRDSQRSWWWRWLLRMLAGSVWGLVLGLIAGGVLWYTRPHLIGSWEVIYILALSGAVFGLVFARTINGLFTTLLRLLRVFLP